MGHKIISKLRVVLANSAVAIQGAPACIDRTAGSTQGQAVPSAVDTNLLPVGRFTESLTGDGTKTVEIELFNPKRIHFFTNAGSNTVDATDIGGPCYWSAAGVVAVPADVSGSSMAGRVWIVEGASGARVGIETADAIGLQGPPGEDA
ncbi:MAG: hypothetical protein J0L92_03675 [Deltaproteobacteria bacterium]|nr:hypothetical protein [Deltaproteobacteria bacterium]